MVLSLLTMFSFEKQKISAILYYLCLFSVLQTTTVATVVSVTGVSDWGQLRSCVQTCLYGRNAADLPYFLGCPYTGSLQYQNECFCRADLASSVSLFVTSCLSRSTCIGTVDQSAGLSIYNNYCQTALNGNAVTTTLAANGGAQTTKTSLTIVTATSSPVSSGASEYASHAAHTPLLARIILGAFVFRQFWC